MTENCCASTGNIMILACSGGSNVGQLSNQAAIELTREGVGKIFCLAGIGAQLSGFVQSAWDAETMVVLDGCPIGCAKAIFEQAKVPLKNHLVITELGIEKNKNLSLRAEDIARVKAAVCDTCGVKPGASPLSPKTASCCG